jgi:hypothetical protein
MHWTQTPAGRKKMSRILRAAHARRKRAREFQAPHSNGAPTPEHEKQVFDVLAQLKAKRERLNIAIEEFEEIELDQSR